MRTLDNSDDEDNDLVSVHLQAKVSVGDESSSHLVKINYKAFFIQPLIGG